MKGWKCVREPMTYNTISLVFSAASVQLYLILRLVLFFFLKKNQSFPHIGLYHLLILIWSDPGRPSGPDVPFIWGSSDGMCSESHISGFSTWSQRSRGLHFYSFTVCHRPPATPQFLRHRHGHIRVIWRQRWATMSIWTSEMFTLIQRQCSGLTSELLSYLKLGL